MKESITRSKFRVEVSKIVTIEAVTDEIRKFSLPEGLPGILTSNIESAQPLRMDAYTVIQFQFSHRASRRSHKSSHIGFDTN